MANYGERIRQLALTLKTFEMLVARWEQNNEPPPKVEAVSSSATSKYVPVCFHCQKPH